MPKSPLFHPRVLAVERKLDAGQLDEAQHLLASLGDDSRFVDAVTYLAIRLRHLRGRLAPEDVAERLRQLLGHVPEFPEAQALLDKVQGTTAKKPTEPPRTAAPAKPTAPPVVTEKAPPTTSELVEEIPKAAALPRMTPPEKRGRSRAIPDLGTGKSSRPPPGFAADVGETWEGAPLPVERAPVSEPAMLIHSGAPPEVEARSLTLFEIADLLDAGKVDEALSALPESIGSESDRTLMEARVFARAARIDEALDRIRRLAHAPLLEPEIRATVARLALELGDAELAIGQAELAHADDPNPPLVRLSFAWARMRQVYMAQKRSPARIGDARDALSELGDGVGPNAALILALRAMIEAEAGQPARAIRLAEHSLSLEPGTDALAALALGARLVGDEERSTSALARLESIDAAYAKAVSTRILRISRVTTGSASGSIVPTESASTQPAAWDESESLIGLGEAEAVWWDLMRAAERTETSIQADHEPPVLAAVAASFLTRALVTRDFGPYDLSLASLSRLDAIFELFEGVSDSLESEEPLALLVGAYVGESLRNAFGLRWRDKLDAAENARVGGNAGEWKPMAMVKERARGGRRFDDDERVKESRLTQHVSILPPVTAPCPWDPAAWPLPEHVGEYAHKLAETSIGAFCKKRGKALTFDTESAMTLDDYLELCAPAELPRPADGRWARRPALLCGAYLGEVIARATGAHWIKDDSLALGPERFRLARREASVAAPVAYAWARLTSDAAPLADWLAAVLDRANA